ncbi:MAG: rhomboid family intramembrane serine protease [Alistipes sp.]|jgi:membrane associated rhomboid family serine protease|nr:rhomboid family intramembrane serine protease [Alistipes sp.]
MMFNTRNSRWGLPPVVQNLLIANVMLWLATWMAMQFQSPRMIGLLNSLALYPAGSPLFRPWQPVTYMFMHGSWEHVIFNMFTLWMFGRIIEYDMRSRRFLLYYMVCGVGAGLMQLLVCHLTGAPLFVPTVGASGAVYGLLLAFGMLHPNDIIMPLIPPIPMKAKWAVVVFCAIELLLGIRGSFFSADNVAHFAHLGGALFGFVLLWWWLRQHKLYRRS